MSSFLADLTTRRIHHADRPAQECCIHEIAAENQLLIHDESEVLRMVELEAYEPCPACLSTVSWTQ